MRNEQENVFFLLAFGKTPLAEGLVLIGMKQAILVTAYKNLQSLERLVLCFDNEFDFYIHIDKKCKERIPVFNRDGIYVVKRYRIQWGSTYGPLSIFSKEPA